MARRIVGTIYTDDDIPAHFDSEDEEAEFWETHELSLEYIRAHRLPRGQSPYKRLQGKGEAGRSHAKSAE